MPYEKLLQDNKEWAKEMERNNPGYFKRLAQLQTPEFLWIGCSDSRVSADQITGTQPGEIFVHRNIANVVRPGDGNLLAVLQYSLEVLEVKHVIVCGHYGCGGVEAALREPVSGALEEWLGHIRDVYREHRTEIDAI